MDANYSPSAGRTRPLAPRHIVVVLLAALAAALLHAAPAHGAVVGMTKLQLGSNSGSENYVYTAGNTIAATANMDAGKYYRMVVTTPSGTVRQTTTCRVSFSSTVTGSYVVAATDPLSGASSWKYDFQEFTNSACSGTPFKSGAVYFSVAAASSYSSAALTTSKSFFPAAAAAYLRFAGLGKQKTSPTTVAGSDWKVTWISPSGATVCANTLNADRPDSAASGGLPVTSTSSLLYRPNTTAADTFNREANYETRPCADFSSANQGLWKVRLDGDATHFVTLPAFTVDTTPPDTTITGGPAGATNSTAPSFLFTGSEAGTTFECKLDAAAYAACTSPKAYTGLANGSHTFSVRSIDPAGNVDATPATRTWTVDTTLPSVTLTAPLDDAWTTPTPTFAGTAGTAAGDSATVTVKAFRVVTGQPDALAGTYTATRNATTGAWSVAAFPGLAEGQYNVYAQQSDTAGNVATSSFSSFNVDATVPVITIDSPTGGQSLDIPAPTITGVAGTAAGDSPTVTVKIYLQVAGSPDQLVQTQTTTAAGDGSWTLDVSPDLADGNYAVRAEQSDASGNVGVTAARQFSIDTNPAETTITAAPAGPTSATDVRMRFVSSEPGATFDCRLDGSLWSQCTSPKTYSGLAQGVHTFDVRAIDASGNADPSPATVTWVVDTTLPRLAVDAPVDGSVTNSATPTFAGTAGTLDGDSDQVSVVIASALTGAPVATLTATSDMTTGTWSVDAFPALADGEYVVHAEQVDWAGNRGYSPTQSFAVDTTPGDTYLTAAPSGTTGSTAATLRFNGSDSDATFECRLDGGGWVGCTSPRSYSGLSAGAHTFDVRSTDSAGNVDQTPASASWTVDTDVPAVTLDTPADGALTRVVRPVLSGMGGTDAGDLDPVTVEIHRPVSGSPDVVVDTVTATRAGDGSWSAMPSANLADGSYTAVARQSDSAGNVGVSATHAFTVDATPPNTSITASPAGTSSSDDATLAFAGTSSTDTYECSVDGGPWTACSSPYSLTSLTDDVHSFAVRAVDAAGNVDPTPANVTWVVDTSLPQVTLTLPADGAALASATPTISGGAGTAPGDVQTVNVSIYRPVTGSPDELIYEQAVTPAADGSWSMGVFPGLPDGRYRVLAEQSDSAGNNAVSPGHWFTIDTAAPETTVTSGPSGWTGSSAASFGFTSTETGSTFECRIDAGTWAPCTSPRGYSGLAEGAHTFNVRATDAVGNLDSTPAARTFTVDTTAPAPTISAPAAGSSTSDSTPALSGGAGTASGDVASVTARVYAGSDTTGTLVQTLPASVTSGAWSTTASTLADGTYTIVVQQADAAGNTGSSAARTFTVDTAAPNTSIVSGPSGTIGSASASFGYSATETGSTFQCRLDAGTWGACNTSPKSYTGLADGAHTFEVRATDVAGNVDATPASRSFTVDTTAPNTTISSGPSGYTGSTSAAFGFTSTETGSTFECRLDTGAWSACSSPDTSTSIAEGAHTFSVRATDAVGNLDASPATRSFTVDTTAPVIGLTAPADGSATADATPTLSGPAGTATGDTASVTVRIYDGTDSSGIQLQARVATVGAGAWTIDALSLGDGTYTAVAEQLDGAGNLGTSAPHTFTVDTAPPTTTIDSGPSGATASASATFGFSSNETGATFQCRLDAGTWAACTSPKTLAGVADGAHTFSVRAIDAAGSIDATPASRAFSVDTTPPDTSITAGPSGYLASTSASFDFSTTETGSSFQCRLDGGTWAACTSPRSLTGLGQGAHVFDVRSVDAVGNPDPSPATRSFTVDTVAPTPTLDTPADAAVTADTTPSLAGAAGTAAADSTTVTVKIYAGSTATGTAVRTQAATATGGAWTLTTSPALADGTYTARPQQADAAGNTGFGAPHTFRVDTTAPDTSVTSGPSGRTAATSASFTFSSTEAGSTFECRLGTGSWFACSGTPTYSGLGDGAQTFQVRATDVAGNLDATPASRSFTVDTTAPALGLSPVFGGGGTGADSTPALSGSAGTATGDLAAVTVRIYAGGTATGTPVQTLAATVVGGAWSATASSALADGTYTAEAEQDDDLGNTGTSLARTFSIDTAPPGTSISAGPLGDTSATTQAFSFAADESGATFECRLDGGGWTACASPKTYTGLSNASHTFEVRALDSLANADASPASRTWTVDTSLPPVTLDQPADGDSVNDAKPALSGSGGTAAGDLPGVTVKVYRPGTGGAADTLVETITTTLAGDGSWSATPAGALADGDYYAFAEQSDSAGNTAVSVPHAFTVDVTAPVVTLTAPGDGDDVNDASVSFAGVAGAAAGDSSSVDVKLYSGASAGGTPLDTLSATRSGGAWSVAVAAPLADGTYTAVATQADSAGNSGASSSVTFTVDTAAPVVSVDSPADGSRLRDSTPALSGSAGVVAGDLPAIAVEVYRPVPGGGADQLEETVAVTAAGDGSWSAVASAPLAEGDYYAVARQSDRAGNTAASSRRAFTIDVSAPAVTLSAPADGDVSNDASTLFSGAAGSDAGDSSSVDVEVYSGASAAGPPLDTLHATRSGAGWSVAVAASLADGTYTAVAVQADSAGNSGVSSTVTFVVDTAAPVVTVDAPADGARLGDATPALSGSAGVVARDLSAISVGIYRPVAGGGADQLVETVAVTAAGDGSWSAVPAAPLSEGDYYAVASQSDSAGNVADSAHRAFTVDTTAPAVTLTAPADGDVANDAGVAFAGAAGTAAGDSSSIDVSVYSGASASGTPLDTLHATRSGAGWSVAVAAPLADGTYTAVAVQADSAGNSGASSGVTFTVDTAVPVVTVDSPADGARLADATPTLSGSAGVVARDLPAIGVKLYRPVAGGGADQLVETVAVTAAGDGSWSAVPSAPLSEGDYYAVASQSDGAGNTTDSAHRAFSVDLTAPTVTLTAPADGNNSSDATPAFEGGAGAGAGDSTAVDVKLYSGASATGTPVDTLHATRSGAAWTVAAGSPLADGTYTAVATQADSAGHTGTSSTVTFTVDSSLPPIALDAPADGAAVNDATPALRGSGGTAASDVPAVAVKIYRPLAGGGADQLVETITTSVAGDGSWSATPTAALAEASYYAYAEQSDTAGNTAASPHHAFTVDLTAPDVTLTAPADGEVSNDASPAFAGAAGTAAGDSATVDVELYSGASASGAPLDTLHATRTGATWTVAPSAPLADGTYTARATQADSAGNGRTTGAATFTVDTTAPQTEITQPPPANTTATTAEFTFDASEPGVAFRCRLDGGDWSPCTSPTAYTGLAVGSHSFEVEAVDAAGNPEPVAPKYTWVVEAPPADPVEPPAPPPAPEPQPDPAPQPPPQPEPQPQPVPPAKARPLLSLSITGRARQADLRRGRLTATVRCGRACSVKTWAKLSFAGPGGRRRVTLAMRRAAASPGHAAKVTFAVPRRIRALVATTLRKRGRVALVLAAEGKATDGGSALAYDRVPFSARR